MNKDNDEIIFWGATGHAKVLKECLKYTNKKLVALFDINPDCKSPFPDIPLYYGKEGFKTWLCLDKSYDFLIAIGGDKGKDRIEIAKFLGDYGLVPYQIIHPTAFVASDVKLGSGTQVLANATVCVGVNIGIDCIINSAAIVDHECSIGHGVHVCPGAHLAGCVTVGDMATIGTGAIILPRIHIGESAIVGAGAVVTKDVAEKTIVVGNPARELSDKQKSKGLEYER